MLKSVRFILLILSVVAFSLTSVQATHLRAGDITVTRSSCSSYSFIITLHIYTRCSSPVKFGGGVLNFGDGTTYTTDDRKTPPQISDADGGICEVTYPVEHTYGGGGVFMITYYEQNRNEGILNISNSVNVPFFVQTQIVVDDIFLGCNDTPQLLVPPIDMGCTGVAWFHNPGAYDENGDSLSYELYTPKSRAVYDPDGLYLSSVDVAYTNPSLPPFSHARESEPGPPIYKIDPVTGTITWDAPGKAGEYNIAFIIREWRKVDGAWHKIGYVERDMQIIIQDCENKRPILQVPPDICVDAGTNITQDISATDPAFKLPRTSHDGDATKIEAFSEIFGLDQSRATYVPNPAIFQPTTNDTDQAHLQFNWQTICEHVKEQPYEVVFKATDNGTPPLAAFETWRIKVVAPAPQLISAILSPGTRSAVLSWQKYACQSQNAQLIQVWRRVDSVPFVPPPCVTGMPDYLGYQLIGTTSIGAVGYTDKGLAPGAKYCYRLVTVFKQPDGGESYVSNEVCMPPILADAPVITNVSVDVTHESAGQITVKWRSPFEANTSQFPKPYAYKVFRADGQSGKINLVEAFTGTRQDSVWVDTDLNTAQISYNYRVVCYDNNGGLVDTSAVASAVRLELRPLQKQIELSWNAIVPWSNMTALYPNHLIYRGTKTTTEPTLIDSLVLIDSVDVNLQKFAYLDSGQYQNTPLIKSQEYCYAVMTRGTYGNPKIKAPLVNFSEITCAIPDNTTKPCKPILALKPIACADDCFEINKNVAQNIVKWKRPKDPSCRNDVKAYNVYASNGTDDTFTKIAEMVTDTFYIENGLQSFARCYKVTAVSRSGIEGDPSNQFCFENCPYYELPNVFTPNGDPCNDRFSAYNVNNYLNDEAGWPCGYKFYKVGTNILDTARNHDLDSIHYSDIKSRCARFVVAVNFTVYNRWGKEVYHYEYNVNQQSDDGSSTSVYNPLYINWNGKDNNGHDLDPGVYYYGAGVVFAAADPKKRNKTIKGWVQIIR